jgi:ArsR family transcriptional regulator
MASKPNTRKATPAVASEPGLEPDQVFEQAADLFKLMAAPMRLKIISSLCNSEKNVGQLLAEIKTTQPNMSQHLNTLYGAGVLGKRRDGVQIFYRIVDDRAAKMCRAVCMQIAIEGDHYSI